jgi:hypothetical protein
MDRKTMIREYKETPRPAGVYRVVHAPSGRTLLGSSADAPARLNRLQTQLRTRGHPNRALQRDWNEDGADAFTFEVLDLLPPREDEGGDPQDDLRMLEELWREKLGLPAESQY